MKRVTVEIVAVGNELLAGDILDTNFGALARALRDVGAEVVRHVTLPDDREAIAAGVREATGRADLVVVTGGLGPTADDVTRFGVAEGIGRPLVSDVATIDNLKARFRQFGIDDMPVGNEVQALFPEGTTILDNPRGTAAGFLCEVPAGAGTCLVCVLPGPPKELVPMIDRHLLPHLKRRGGLPVLAVRRLRTMGIGESLLAERIAVWPFDLADVDLGYYPQDPGVDLKLTARGATPAEAEGRLDAAAAHLDGLLGPYIYSVEAAPEPGMASARTPLAAVVGRLLRKHGARVAVAESCTGGLLASMITAVAGSSDYFDGGVVTYSNEAKADLAGVPAGLIAAHGAVSEEVARALADGVRARRGVDYALGVTGVAGPGGGTEEKPVGLVWIAVAGPGGTTAHRTRHAGDRTTVQKRAAATALDFLRRRLQADAAAATPGKDP